MPPVTDTLDGALIEPDEDGFHLVLSGHRAEYDFFLPGAIAEELLRATKREVQPWLEERDDALRTYVPEREEDDEPDGPARQGYQL